MELQREIALRRADQQAEVAAHEESRRQAAGEAAIAAKRALDQAQLQSDQAIEAERITLQRSTREAEIASARELDIADIARRREVELAEQAREAEVSTRSMARSKAQADAEGARAEAVRAEEAVISAREVEHAESVKPLERIEGVKILHVTGLGAAAPGDPAGKGGGLGWADQLVDSALRHRTQAPLVDHLLKELGIGDGSPAGISAALTRLSSPTAADTD